VAQHRVIEHTLQLISQAESLGLRAERLAGGTVGSRWFADELITWQVT
jgi:hypothetical protein